MGSLARRLKRTQQKLAYGEFGEAFNEERRYQAMLRLKGEPLPKDRQEIKTRKPPFAVWVRAVQENRQKIRQQIMDKAKEVAQKKLAEAKPDLSWDEEAESAPPLVPLVLEEKK